MLSAQCCRNVWSNDMRTHINAFVCQCNICSHTEFNMLLVALSRAMPSTRVVFILAAAARLDIVNDVVVDHGHPRQRSCHANISI